uniref:Reverse transcriptase domain-containing protein n=1 Tax=Lates calcarifer TaxID=8187 RepID=A0A4W6DNS9_LATCA
MEALQDCFECTDWDMFKTAATYNDHTNIDEYATSVSAYISKCTEDVSVRKTIIIRANQKPWMTAEVRKMLKARNSAFKSVNRAIRLAKHTHSKKIQDLFHDSTNTSNMWNGIRAITNHKVTPTPVSEVDADFLNELNNFFGRFEALNSTRAEKALPHQHEKVLCLDIAEVRKSLRRVNTRKAPGPDNIQGRVLNDCADQLACVLTDIFNTSLDRPNCCTEDAISSALHPSLAHLEEKNTHVRLLFLDFSSAFNTIIPQHLVDKLGPLGFSTPLRNWLIDFLTDRPQSVRVGQNTSSVITLSTGSPQGCVLSPLLFTLMTHDCFPRHATNRIVKFADDTTVVGLIRDDNDLAYREEVEQLVDWCKDNSLILNVDKTKELIVDFRENQPSHAPLLINNKTVEVVSSTKFLGVHITDDLTWSVNTASLVKRAQQRMYFLRRMRRAHLPPPILTTFYRSTIESILTSCISVWCGGCSASDWKDVRRVVRTAERIIRTSLPSIQDIAENRCASRARKICSDSSHPHHGLFTPLASGKRFRSMRCRTTRFYNSFDPQAIRLLNTSVQLLFVNTQCCWSHMRLLLYIYIDIYIYIYIIFNPYCCC